MIHDSGTFKGWILSDHLDEVVPDNRPSPDDWLVRGDGLRLASKAQAFNDPEAWHEPDDAELIGKNVEEGDLVCFCGLTEFGIVRVDVAKDGSYRALDPVAPEATCFWLKHDMDTFSGSLEDLVKGSLDSNNWGRVVQVDCYDWSERTFVLKDGAFVLLPDKTVVQA